MAFANCSMLNYMESVDEIGERRFELLCLKALGFRPSASANSATPPKYRNYTDEDIVKYAKEVKSIAGLLRKLNLKPLGGNYATMRRNIARLEIDTSHWTGQLWSEGLQLKDWKEYKSSDAVRRHLIRIHGYRCEGCKISSWLGQRIPIELDHIDGNTSNNSEDNLIYSRWDY